MVSFGSVSYTHLDVYKRQEVLIAEEDEKPVGFALYFHNFSTFVGKPGIYLEDLFVEPEMRGKGYGKALLVELAKIAKERNCGRLESVSYTHLDVYKRQMKEIP